MPGHLIRNLKLLNRCAWKALCNEIALGVGL